MVRKYVPTFESFINESYYTGKTVNHIIAMLCKDPNQECDGDQIVNIFDEWVTKEGHSHTLTHLEYDPKLFYYLEDKMKENGYPNQNILYFDLNYSIEDLSEPDHELSSNLKEERWWGIYNPFKDYVKEFHNLDLLIDEE